MNDDTIRRYTIINTSNPDVFKCTILQEKRNYKIILNNGCGSSSSVNPDYVRWHPDGLLFSYEINESDDLGVIKTTEVLNNTSGFLFIHDWKKESTLSGSYIPLIQKFPAIISGDTTLGEVYFLIGEESERRIGEREKKYLATATNAVSISYSLDIDSLIAGNKINSSTGVVTWSNNWIGESVITATITGVSGSAIGTHTVITKDDTEEEPYYDAEDVLSDDLHSIYRKVRVSANRVELDSEDLYYIMLKYPLSEDNEIGTIIVSKTFYREHIYEGYLLILLGVLNSVANNRILSMEWGSGGEKIKKTIPSIGVTINTRWMPISETCLLGTDGKYTGQLEVYKKKQVYNEETEVWDDLLEETTEIITDTTKCPIPQKKYFIAISCDSDAYDFTSENFIVAVKGSENSIDTKSKSGYNYSFISLPKELSNIIYNSLHKNITNQFELVSGSSDIRAGYEENQIWKKLSMFGTKVITTYTIKL